MDGPGAVEVIDTVTLERITSIPTGGGIHNVYVTPDSRFVVAGSIAGRKMTVIDAKTNEPSWTLFNEGIRPIAFACSCSCPKSMASPSLTSRRRRKWDG